MSQLKGSFVVIPKVETVENVHLATQPFRAILFHTPTSRIKYKARHSLAGL